MRLFFNHAVVCVALAFAFACDLDVTHAAFWVGLDALELLATTIRCVRMFLRNAAGLGQPAVASSKLPRVFAV